MQIYNSHQDHKPSYADGPLCEIKDVFASPSLRVNEASSNQIFSMINFTTTTMKRQIHQHKSCKYGEFILYQFKLWSSCDPSLTWDCHAMVNYTHIFITLHMELLWNITQTLILSPYSQCGLGLWDNNYVSTVIISS